MGIMTGVQYVQLDLTMMLEMLHVDNWDMYEPVMSTPMITSTYVWLYLTT